MAPGDSTQIKATARASDGRSLESRLITWASSDSSTARVDGTEMVTAVAEGTATITASSDGKSATADVVVRIPVASVVVSPGNAALNLGETVQLQAAAYGVDGSLFPDRDFLWESTDPAVATVDGSGRVVSVSVGSASITATAQGRAGAATVSVHAPLSVSTSRLADGVVGEEYTQALAASGGNGTYLWAIRSGSLPAGLALDFTTGVVAGVPEAEGTSIFNVEVASDDGQTATRSFSITVRPILNIQTNSLSDATVGMPYHQALSAAGGDGSYSWSLSDGTLPGGLSLDEETGVISGTATAAGWSSFTVLVESAGQSKTKVLTITVW